MMKTFIFLTSLVISISASAQVHVALGTMKCSALGKVPVTIESLDKNNDFVRIIFNMNAGYLAKRTGIWLDANIYEEINFYNPITKFIGSQVPARSKIVILEKNGRFELGININGQNDTYFCQK